MRYHSAGTFAQRRRRMPTGEIYVRMLLLLAVLLAIGWIVRG